MASIDTEGIDVEAGLATSRALPAGAVSRRTFIFTALATAVCAGCRGQKAEMQTPSTMFASFVTQALVEKFSGPRQATPEEELKDDLNFLEQSLDVSNQHLKSRLQVMQQKLSQKASVDDIRTMLQKMVSELESEVQGVEDRTSATESSITKIQTSFGYVPTTEPSPLLRVNVNGEPEALPLITDWAKLLSRSEEHRIKLEKLSAIYKPNALEMQEALQTLEAIKVETTQLQGTTKVALARRLVKRRELLETRKETHPDVQNFDNEISSLTWLVGIAHTEEKGRYEGTLVVSDKLVGPQASDIVAAFKLAGKTTDDIVPLYRKISHLMPGIEDKVNDGKYQMEKDTQDLEKQCKGWMQDIFELSQEVQALDAEIKSLIKDHSSAHPLVVDANKRKVGLLLRIQKLNILCDERLNQCVSQYVRSLQSLRPSNKGMRYFNSRTINPLTQVHSASTCYDWKNPTAEENTWNQFLKQAKFERFVRVSTYKVGGGYGKYNEADFEATQRYLKGHGYTDKIDGKPVTFDSASKRYCVGNKITNIEYDKDKQNDKLIVSPNNQFMLISIGEMYSRDPRTNYVLDSYGIEAILPESAKRSFGFTFTKDDSLINERGDEFIITNGWNMSGSNYEIPYLPVDRQQSNAEEKPPFDPGKDHPQGPKVSPPPKSSPKPSSNPYPEEQ